MRHFTMGMICITQIGYTAQKWEANMKTCIVGIILPKPIKLKHQTQQNIHKPNPNKNTKSKKLRARNMKYFEKKKEPIHILEDW